MMLGHSQVFEIYDRNFYEAKEPIAFEQAMEAKLQDAEERGYIYRRFSPRCPACKGPIDEVLHHCRGFYRGEEIGGRKMKIYWMLDKKDLEFIKEVRIV